MKVNGDPVSTRNIDALISQRKTEQKTSSRRKNNTRRKRRIEKLEGGFVRSPNKKIYCYLFL
jgi:hypothetical protein